MIRTTIYFIRHGALCNPKGILYGQNIPMELSQHGKEGIQHLGYILQRRKISIDVLYTSALPRTIQSGQILAKMLAVPRNRVFLDARLNDVDIPAIAGKPMRYLDDLYNRGIDPYAPEFVRKGNESRIEIRNRMFASFNEILMKNRGSTVCIVSHGDPLRIVLYYLLSKRKYIPSLGVLRAIYYPPLAGGWVMIFDRQGTIVDKKTVPDWKEMHIQY